MGPSQILLVKLRIRPTPPGTNDDDDGIIDRASTSKEDMGGKQDQEAGRPAPKRPPRPLIWERTRVRRSDGRPRRCCPRRARGIRAAGVHGHARVRIWRGIEQEANPQESQEPQDHARHDKWRCRERRVRRRTEGADGAPRNIKSKKPIVVMAEGAKNTTRARPRMDGLRGR